MNSFWSLEGADGLQKPESESTARPAVSSTRKRRHDEEDELLNPSTKRRDLRVTVEDADGETPFANATTPPHYPPSSDGAPSELPHRRPYFRESVNWNKEEVSNRFKQIAPGTPMMYVTRAEALLKLFPVQRTKLAKEMVIEPALKDHIDRHHGTEYSRDLISQFCVRLHDNVGHIESFPAPPSVIARNIMWLFECVYECVASNHPNMFGDEPQSKHNIAKECNKVFSSLQSATVIPPAPIAAVSCRPNEAARLSDQRYRFKVDPLVRELTLRRVTLIFC
jgi:hypothetical protein